MDEQSLDRMLTRVLLARNNDSINLVALVGIIRRGGFGFSSCGKKITGFAV